MLSCFLSGFTRSPSGCTRLRIVETNTLGVSMSLEVDSTHDYSHTTSKTTLIHTSIMSTAKKAPASNQRLSDLALSQHFLGQPVFLLSPQSLCNDTFKPADIMRQCRYPEHAQSTAGRSPPDYESALSLYGRVFVWERDADALLEERREDGEYVYRARMDGDVEMGLS